MADVIALTQELIDLPSESGHERAIADLVEARLRALAHLEVLRDGDAVLARTKLGRDQRILLAGHLDTVPAADGDLPSRLEGDRLVGTGASDMKAALAVMLEVAREAGEGRHDLTFVFYDCEEVAAVRNGLGRLEQGQRDWLEADAVVLMEPTSNAIEAGCQGTLRVSVTVPGRRAHPARAWLGLNAVHEAAPLLERLRTYEPRRVVLDGCEFIEGLQVVRIVGGVAGNVVPDACTITVNHRFAPDRSGEEALAHVREVLAPYEVTLEDLSPGALPNLTAPFFTELSAALGTAPVAKLAWTDVSRFSALGMPALNFGPGDPNLAHVAGESVLVSRVHESLATLRSLLG